MTDQRLRGVRSNKQTPNKGMNPAKSKQTAVGLRGLFQGCYPDQRNIE